MAKTALPCPTVLRQLLRYDPETGEIFWRVRNPFMFAAGKSSPQSHCKTWNSRFADKPAGNVSPIGYHVVCVNGVKIYTHRAAWAIETGCWPDGEIDHINGDRTDNRLANLRDVPKSVNAKNKRKGQRSGDHLGVRYIDACSRWVADIQADGEREHLGTFKSEAAAVAARKAAERRLGFHKNHGR